MILIFFIHFDFRLYVQGVNMNPLGCFEPVQFPVPKNTPFVSPMIEKIWDHSVSWWVPNPDQDRRKFMGNERHFDLDQASAANRFFKGR